MARTVHGVHGLEGDDLGHGDVHLAQELLQVVRVVVAEDVLRRAAVQDALDHGGVVPRVRENVGTWGREKHVICNYQG